MTERRNFSYQFGPFRLSAEERLLFRGDQPVPTTPKALDLLLALVECAGRVVDKQQLLEKLWPDAHVEEANLSQTVYVLRKALAENGNGPEYIETIPKRGYRFIGHVRLIEAEPALAGRRGRDKSRPYMVAAAVVLVLLAGYLLRSRLQRPGPARAPAIRLAVIPFINLSSSDQDEFFADGLTEDMITELGQINSGKLEVFARATAMKYKATQKSPAQIAAELGADYLFTGAVRRDGSRVRVNAQLIRAREQVHLWAASYDREVRDLIALQSEVAREIAGQIQLTLSPAGEARLARRRPIHPEAFEAYLRGRHLWNRRTPESERGAREYFERAIELEPEYAEAYASLAESYAPRVRRDFRGEPLARKALQLHPDLPEAHAALGAIYHYLFDWDGASRGLRRALELNPNHGPARMWNAQNLLALGRFDEALIEIDRALKLDPLSVLMHNVKGTIYYYSRRYDDAVRQFHKTVELDGEGSLWPRLRLAGAYAQKGMFQEAEKHFLKARVIAQPVSELRMAYAYAINGKRREAAKILDRWKRTHSPGYDVAVLHTALGNAATALDILEQIYRDGNANLVYLGVDPRLDPLRAQPRFQELLRKLRLAS